MIKYIFLSICFVCHAVCSLSQTDTIPRRLRDTTLLRTVTVQGRKTLVKPTLDGFVYQAGKDMAIAAGSAIDVLRRIPLVTIGADGMPRIQGSSNVRVYIDNKPSQIYASSVADALQQISAEDIASVEVITQPSSRFDGEGTDAVINIITKKNQYNGVTGRLGTVAGNRTRQGSASVKWRRKELVFSLEGNWYRYNNALRTMLARSSYTGNDLQEQKDSRSIWNTYVVSPVLTWIIDSLHVFTAGYRYRSVRDASNSIVHTAYTTGDSILALTRYIDNDYINHIHSMNIGYTGTSANKKRELNLLAFYHVFMEDPTYSLQQTREGMVDHKENSEGRIDSREWSVQADLVQSLGKASKLEAGGKIVSRTTRSFNKISIFDFAKEELYVDPIRSTRFDYDRSFYAFYVNYIVTFNRWSIRIGSRYERTTLFAGFKDTALRIPDYNNWLPNLLISKTLGEHHTLKLSYAKKITRPYLSMLNPTVNYVDSFNIEYGNPALLPEIAHSWQLVYQFNKNKLMVTATFFTDYRNNSLEQIRLVKQGISEITYGNVGHHLSYGASANLSFDDNKRANASAGITAKYVKMESPALELSNSGWFVFPTSRFSYRFNKSLQAETVVTYYPSPILLQGRGGDWFFYTLIVNKKWWKDKLQTSLSMDNFFTGYQYAYEVLHTQEFDQTTTKRYPVGFFKLGLVFRFGRAGEEQFKKIKIPDE